MINLGVIDILLIAVLISMYFYARRQHEMLIFYAALVLIALIEVERLIPGTLKVIGEGIRGIDTINAGLPHIEISPIVNIK